MKRMDRFAKRLSLTVGLLLLVGLFTVGCGDDDGVGDTAAEAPAPTEAPAPAEEVAVESSVGRISTEDYVPDLEAANKNFTIGVAILGTGIDFHVMVEEGFHSAAEEAGVEMVLLDNNYDAAQSVENARALVVQGVDAVIEYQCDAPTNEIIAEIFADANIPVIAIDCPVPGAPFFGGSNTVAGTIGGEELGRFVSDYGWDIGSTAFVYLDFTPAGAPAEARRQGYIDGFKSVISGFPDDQIFDLDVEGTEDALNQMRSWIAGNPDFEFIAVGSIEDGRALGAHGALVNAGREDSSVLVSQGCDGTAQGFIRANDPIFKGSVDYGPKLYGFNTISMALDILNGDPVPEEFFVQHMNCSASTIDQLYPAN